MRTFVALSVNVEQNLKVILHKIRDELKDQKIKWVNFDTLHLTLFFLGETSNDQVADIKTILKTELSSFDQFKITLSGIGMFGGNQNPKVLWLGINHSNELAKLHQIVNDAIKTIGFTPDERGFNPHITIGRIKQLDSPKLLSGVIDRFKYEDFQCNSIDSVTLYSSNLTPKGPIYTPVFKQSLK